MAGSSVPHRYDLKLTAAPEVLVLSIKRTYYHRGTEMMEKRQDTVQFEEAFQIPFFE